MIPMKIITKSIFRTALSLAAVVLFGTQASAQCDPPIGSVVISNIQTTSVKASWGLSPSEIPGGQYRWEIRLASESPAAPGAPGAIEDGFTDNGLLDATIGALDFDTDYIVYVAYKCSDAPTVVQSGWIASAIFSTATLQPPTATPPTAVTDISMKANWLQSPAADSYILQVATDASFTTFLAGYSNFPTTALFENLSGLSPNTTYYYRVASVGDNGVDPILTTAYSNVVSRTTLGPGTSFYTWQSPGEWFPSAGVPDETKDVIIDFDYDTSTYGSFEGKTLTINSGYTLTISSPTEENPSFVDLIGTITNLNPGNLGLVVKSGGFLTQSQNGANLNTGGMVVERESSELYRLDYTMWSSPTTGQPGNLGNQTLLDFSPLTAITRFYTYNETSNLFAAITSPSTTKFEPGHGYLIRVRNNHPAFVPSAPVSGTKWLGTFEGPINGGLYTVPLEVANDGYNMIGNPYPSLLALDKFLDNNPNLGGTLYFWRRKNDANEDNGNTSAYYATYTYAGGTGVPSAIPSDDAPLLVPEPYIQVGQGFIVKAVDGLSSPQTVTFNNSMRSKDLDSTPFFRNATVDKNRFWLSVSNNVQTFNQMLVAYLPTATNGVDRADGKFFGEASVALTSYVANEEYVIQGRAPFTTSDVVPLHFRTPNAGTFTIKFNRADGLFNGAQNIYLKDNLTNTMHNIKTAPYTFVTAAGVFAQRFEIVYESPLSVANPVFDANVIVLYKQNGAIQINSGGTIMSDVKIFDIRGRLVAQKNNVNASETSINAGAENQVLIVQITSDNNSTVSKKFVN